MNDSNLRELVIVMMEYFQCYGYGLALDPDAGIIKSAEIEREN
jgi:hypothetical protein